MRVLEKRWGGTTFISVATAARNCLDAIRTCTQDGLLDLILRVCIYDGGRLILYFLIIDYSITVVSIVLRSDDNSARIFKARSVHLR